MRTLKNISLISLAWFASWAVFVLLLEQNGIDYVNNYLLTCGYFALIIAILYTFLGTRIKAHANHFSSEEIGIASISLVLGLAIYYFLDHFIIPTQFNEFRSSLHWALQVNNTFLISKAFEIMFQQAFFIVAIDYLFENGLPQRKDVGFFGLYVLILHLPLLYISTTWLSAVFISTSFFAGEIFSYLIVRNRYGFLWSYIIHYSFYIILPVLYWLWQTSLI